MKRLHLTEQHKKRISEAHKGMKHTEETLRKMSLAKKGKPCDFIKTKFEKGQTPWNKGLTKETDERVRKYGESGSKSSMGKILSSEHKRKLRANLNRIRPLTIKANIGRKHSKEHKEKISNALRGEKSYLWRGGCSPLYVKEFTRPLKNRIRERDKFKCRMCGIFQTESEMVFSIHHIDYNRKNNSFNNLISLCNSCHSKTNYYRNDYEQYLLALIKAEHQYGS